jgi:serine/threonine-protein kinase
MSGVDQRLGSRYVLKERLGRGAMGTVWRALNTETNQDVAVKILSEELSDEPEMVTRFIQERNTLIAVRHPNLVRIHDLVVENGKLGIVMDLVAGPDLHKHLAERGVLSLAEAAVIGRGVADALAAIHAAGIIHRDLKPANILLDLSGPQAQPKLVDFGIARMLAGSRLTSRSSVVGTPQYLSPEAISGAEPSPALDVYAFGIALYELLTGAPPFHGDQLLQVLNQHMYQEPQWPQSIPPQILPLLQAMLAKDPQARPTALDISAAMNALVANLGPVTFPRQAPAAQPPVLPVPQQQAWPAVQQQPAPPSPLPGPQSPVQASPYGVPQAPQTPYPQAPQTPFPQAPQTPYPQQPQQGFGPPPGPGTPLPGGYGTPGQSPIPAPSPSGFFYPGREMLGESDTNAEDTVFTPNPPPFTEDMFTVKKPQRRWRKPLLIGLPVVAVLVAGGLIAALTLGGGNSPTPKPIAAGTSTSSPAAVTVASCPAEASVGIAASARWTLDGTPGDCSVAPSTANSLTLTHGARWTNSSSHGHVLKLDTGNAVATVPNTGFVNTSASFSVSIWVYLSTLNKSKYSTVLIMQGNSIDAFKLEYNPGWGGWAFNRSSEDNPKATWIAAASKTAPKTNAWTHLVGVYDAAAKTMSLYINGTLAAQTPGVVAWDANAQIALGANIYQNGTTYDGLVGNLSDLQIFDSALTAKQVSELQ